MKPTKMRDNIKQRGKKSWAIKLELERDPVTGKRRQAWHTVHGTRRDAEIEKTRLLHQLNEGSYIEPHKVTVRQHLECWLRDYATHHVAAKTLERYREICDKHLIPALGHHRLAKLRPMEIQAYYSEALKAGRLHGEGGLSAQTVKHHHRVLSQALRQAVKWQILAKNPCEAVEAPRPVGREMRILDQSQTAALLRAAEGSWLYMPILLAVTTGMRRGEVLGLSWRDVHLDQADLSVTQSLEQTAAGLALKAPKTPRSRRSISLPALSVEALRRHRTAQNEERLRAGPSYAAHGLVCCRADGQPLSPRDLTKAFGRLLARLGFGAVRFHDLRHTHISHLLQAGVHPKVASERAGHASVAITLDIYSHVVPGLQVDAASRIDAALRAELDR